MNWYDLTNRETASLILLLLLCIGLLTWGRSRRVLLPGVRDVLKALVAPVLLLTIGLYFTYTVAIVIFAASLGLWSFEWNLKDTIIISIFVGLPLLFNAHKLTNGRALVGKVIRGSAGITALLIFYLSIDSLPLWGELITQFIIILLTLLSSIPKRDEATQSVIKICSSLLTFIGFSLLIYTTIQLVKNWQIYNLTEIISSFALSIWLPAALIPLIYILAFMMICENLFNSLAIINDRKKPKLQVMLALFLSLRMSTHLAANFNGQWRSKAAKAKSVRQMRVIMKEYKKSLIQIESKRKSHKNRLIRFAGVVGVDEHGLQLDRREFAATKKALNQLYFMQMGWHRNRLGHFKSDMLDLLALSPIRGLPENHGIVMKVRKDKQAWRAWRRTKGGWYFGVGGTKKLEDEWQYFGPNPPTEFPSVNSLTWVNATSTTSLLEWSHYDELD